MIGKNYRLTAVIQYKPQNKHFVSHVKRNMYVWKTYDDLKSHETVTDVTKEILPYMLYAVTRIIS